MKIFLALLLIFSLLPLHGEDDLVLLEVVAKEIMETPPPHDAQDRFWFVSPKWLWFGVMRSDKIVVGSIVRQKSSQREIEAIVQVDEFLKGSAVLDDDAFLNIRYSTNLIDRENPEKTLRTLQEGLKYVFFLQKSWSGDLYVDTVFMKSIQAETVDFVDSVRKEIQQQSSPSFSFDENDDSLNFRYFNELKTKLSVVTQSDERQETFVRRVLELGVDCAPSLIVCLMKESPNRELQRKSVALPNRAEDAFEAFRLYGPNTTVELLDSLLSEITWMHFAEYNYDGSKDTASRIKARWNVFFEKWHLFAKSNNNQFFQPILIIER